jgi:hypothetical protein
MLIHLFTLTLLPTQGILLLQVQRVRLRRRHSVRHGDRRGAVCGRGGVLRPDCAAVPAAVASVPPGKELEGLSGGPQESAVQSVPCGRSVFC